MNWVRATLAGSGLAAAGYGALLLTARPEDLFAIGVWLGGGVILHDLVLAPILIGLCLAGARTLPRRHHLPAVLSLVVFGSLTVVAIPVLGRFGAESDNPTLLDRNYLLGWVLIGALTLLASVLLTRLRATESDGAGEA